MLHTWYLQCIEASTSKLPRESVGSAGTVLVLQPRECNSIQSQLSPAAFWVRVELYGLWRLARGDSLITFFLTFQFPSFPLCYFNFITYIFLKGTFDRNTTVNKNEITGDVPQDEDSNIWKARTSGSQQERQQKQGRKAFYLPWAPSLVTNGISNEGLKLTQAWPKIGSRAVSLGEDFD